MPVIGAGLSADAGVPTLAAVVRYIGAVHALFTHALYLPASPSHLDPADPLFTLIRNHYGDRLDRFLLDHGWPDRFVLQHILGLALQEAQHTPDDVIDESLNCLVAEMHAWESAKLTKLRNLVQPPIPDTEPKDLLLDWRHLIRHVTRHRREIADALFLRLHHGRLPGVGHRYLAFLTKLFGIRSVFTFNFDPLIEAAFVAEGLPHQLFAMESGRMLPPPVLITPPAIIKMHGSTHNLLIDERVDFPLDEEYRRRFRNLVGEDPLLLILGCSGAERRLRDLIDTVLSSVRPAGTPSSPIVIWSHFAKDSTPIPNFPTARRGDIRVCDYRDAGMFLAHIYFFVTSRFPASLHQYPAHAWRFYPSASNITTRDLYHPSCPASTEHASRSAHVNAEAPALVIDGTTLLDPTSVPQSTLPALLTYIGAVPMGFLLVYVDLEDHHSLGGIIADILSQIRQSDTTVMPLLLPVGAPGEGTAAAGISIRAAVRRVLLGLTRQKIALVFDGLESFDWRATTHHGVTTASQPNEEHLLHLREFLFYLIERHRGRCRTTQSRICITIDEPTKRHFGSTREDRPLAHHKADFAAMLVRISRTATKAPASAYHSLLQREPEHSMRLLSVGVASGGVRTHNDYFLQAIATVRRTRSLHMLRSLYEKMSAPESGDDSAADQQINVLVQSGVLVPLEGGFYAMDRVQRNELYDRFTALTSSEYLVRVLCGDSDAAVVMQVAFQLLETLSVHDLCARWYYNNAYLPSYDSHTFFEYVYHRVSALRALTDLIVFCRSNADNGAFIQGLAISRPGGADRSINRIMPCQFETERDLWRLHRRWLCGLSRSWERTEGRLRSAVVPERVLSWCRTLLQYDIKRNIGPRDRISHLRSGVLPEVFIGEAKRPGMKDISFPVEEESESQRRLNELRSVVRETEARCYYERGDFVSMILGRYESIRAACISNESKWSRIDLPSANGQCQVELVTQIVSALHAALPQIASSYERGNMWREVQHWLLDIVIALHWHVYGAGVRRLDQALDLHWSQLISKLEEIAPLPNGEPLADVEAHARCQYIRMERVLGGSSRMGRRALAERGRNEREQGGETPVAGIVVGKCTDRLREVLAEAERAIDLLIDDTEEPGGRMYNPFLNPTDDRTLLIPYRSFFRVLRGRAYGILGRELGDKSGTWYRRAYRECELARASIGKENRALATLCEVASAEAAVAQAITNLQLDDVGSLDIRAVNRQAAKLRSAKAYLELAEKGLAAGGRHILLWRAFALTKIAMITWAIRNEVMRQCLKNSRSEDMQEEGGRGVARAGRLWRMVREALQVVRDGLDHTPVSAGRYQAAFFESWHDLITTAFVAFVAIGHRMVPEGKASNASRVARFWNFWMQMNVQADLSVDRIDGLKALTGQMLEDLLGPYEVCEIESIPKLLCSAVSKMNDPVVVAALWESYGGEWVAEVCQMKEPVYAER